MKNINYLIILVLLCSTISVSAQVIISEPLSVTDFDQSYSRKSPKIAVNADGEIIVFWMRTGANEAFFISTLSNGSFSTPIEIPFGGVNPNLWSGSLGPNMAAKGDHVYVTFEVYGDAIYIIHSSDGGVNWGDPVAAFIPPSGRRATIPVIAVDIDEQPYITYVNTNVSEADAYYGLVRSNDFGATFLPEVDVSVDSGGEEVCECCNGHIDIADNGDVYVSFRNNDNNLRDIWIAQSTDGGDTFTAAYDVDETDWQINACPSNGPHFSIIDDELVSAFFSGSGIDGSGVYFSAFDTQNNVAGATYSMPLTSIEADGQNRPKIAGSGDTLAVVWQEVDGSNEIAMSVSTNGSEDLGVESFLLTDMPSHQRYPSIVFSGSSFHVVYEDSESGTVMYQEVSFGVLGIQEKENTLLSMGPNPCSSTLSVYLESVNPTNIIIIDALGKTVKSEIIFNQNIDLDMSTLKSGLYLIFLEGSRSQAQKLIIR
jgi:hypothetical protein